VGGNGMWMFLYSRRNIAGCVLALAGVALYLTGVIDRFWLPIVVGLYGVGFFATPKPNVALLSADVGEDPAAISHALTEILDRIRDRVEPDVFGSVKSIANAINEALPRLAAGDPQLSGARFTVRQMATDYLPSTLQSYLKLPAGYRRMHSVGGGKTAHDVLQEQLGLLDSKMQEILVSVNENDTQALLANGRFLKEKFAEPAFKVSG
jgi:hypothetical protein